MLSVNIDKPADSAPEKKEVYDTIVLGAGPAGLAAALYSSRSLMSTLVLEKMGSGGQAAITDLIENYPGFPEGINGYELSQKLDEHARKFGARMENAVIEKVVKDPSTGLFRVICDGAEYKSKTVIVASGASPRKLGVKGEDAFIGSGLSFCATCDGAFYRGKTAAVVGGGDSAIDEGLYLTRFAQKVIVIHRRNELRAEKILQKRAFENPKIEFMWNTVVEEMEGDTRLRKLKLRNVKDQTSSTLEIDGLFLYIGMIPNTDFVDGLVRDELGYVVTDDFMRTNIEGLYAAGDCRVTPLRQVVTAVADGAVAAHSVEKYIDSLNN